ncbi:MAG: hypothetical protein E7047_00075 [Lentisphaerae bacterium]|nr:hypothetical protein [Lentisphaerota bacterium]
MTDTQPDSAVIKDGGYPTVVVPWWLRELAARELMAGGCRESRGACPIRLISPISHRGAAN